MSEWVGLIKPNGFECVQINGQYEEYRDLVDGYLETVPTGIRRHLLVINEEGKLRGLPLNEIATVISGVLPFDVIVGNAVLVRLNSTGDDWCGWISRDECFRAFQAVFHASFGRSVPSPQSSDGDGR